MKKCFLIYLVGLSLLWVSCPALAQDDAPSALPQPTTAASPAPKAGEDAAPTSPASSPQSLQEAPASAPDTPPAEIRELWSGSLYTSTYKAGVCIAPDGKVRGVLLLRTMGGKTDTYHFYGSLENGIIRASHGSGHRFAGSFASADEVQGTITLKSGRSINMTGKREHNVELTESCRPLSK